MDSAAILDFVYVAENDLMKTYIGEMRKFRKVAKMTIFGHFAKGLMRQNGQSLRVNLKLPYK